MIPSLVDQLLMETGAFLVDGSAWWYGKRAHQSHHFRYFYDSPGARWFELGSHASGYVTDFIVELKPRAFVEQLVDRYRAKGVELPPEAIRYDDVQPPEVFAL